MASGVIAQKTKETLEVWWVSTLVRSLAESKKIMVNLTTTKAAPRATPGESVLVVRFGEKIMLQSSFGQH